MLKISKKLLSVLLVVIMACSVFTIVQITVSAAQTDRYSVGETYTSGDFKYEIFDDGTAKISDYIGSALKLTIPSELDGHAITIIGYNAFRDCNNLTSVIIPEGVTSIENWAFENCTSLTDITIPNSVMSIGVNAFKNTTWFDNCPDGVVYIGNVVYKYKGNMPAKTVITLDDGTKSITACAFEDCINLISITIPDSVLSIWSSAFEGCANLTNIKIPKNVINIGRNVFSSCKSLSEITVSPENTKYASIDGVLFNKNITELICYPSGKYDSYVICDTVTSIEDGAFNECINLTNIAIPDNVTSIGSSAFRYCTNLKSITIPDSVIRIGYAAFWGCTNLTIYGNSGTTAEIYATENNIEFKTLDTYKYELLDDGTIEIIDYTGAETSLEIPSEFCGYKVTKIGNYAFQNCISLSEITIPESVTNIGHGAFSGCTNLKIITIPDNVIYIGDSAFYECKYLNIYGNTDTVAEKYSAKYNLYFTAFKDIFKILINDGTAEITKTTHYIGSVTILTIPSKIDGYKITGIARQAFQNCSRLTNIVIPNSVTYIAYEAFKGCTSLKSLTIGNCVTEIDGNAFEDCTSLENITIPDSVTYIGGGLFDGCISLVNITIGNNVANINNMVFGVCANLKKINVSTINKKYSSTDGVLFDKNKSEIIAYPMGKNNILYSIPDSVTSISEYAFRGCERLTSIVIPNSVTSISEYAFSGCERLTSIIIPNSVTSIGKNAFGGCERLKSIVIPNSVINIGAWAFSGCWSLESVIIGNNVTTIGTRAFRDTALKTVTIPKSVKQIDNRAFGYYYSTYNYDDWFSESKVDGFTIYGVKGTATETYAVNNGFTFVEFEEKPKITVDEEAKRCSVGSEITITASLNSDEYITEDIQWKSSNNDIAEIISTDSEFSSDKKIQKVVVKGKSKGNAYITATLPDGNEAIVSLLVTEKTCDIVLASYVSNLTVAQGDYLTIHSALKTNTNDNYINGNFSVTMLNNDIAEISNVNKLDNYTEITIKGKKEGQSILCISDLDTGESIGAVITVAPDVYIYRCDQVPQEDRDSHIPSFYTAGLYVDNFKYTVNRQGSNRSYTLRMDLYNETSQYGAVDVFDAKGNWISSEPIDKSNGSLISGLGDMMTAVDGLVSDFGSLLFDKNNIFSDYRISQNKLTSIEVDVPAGGYIEISNNCDSSKGALMYNAADIAVFSAMEVANIASSSSAKESIAAASVKEIVKSAISKSLYDNLDGNNVVKKLAEKITTNFTLNDINTHVENSSDAAIGFLKSINIDFAEVIKNCAKDLGVSIAESVVLEMAGTSGKVVKGLFTFSKYAKFALQLVHISNTTNGIPVRVYTLDNNDNLVSNGVIIKPTDKQLSTNFVCQAFQIYDGEEYETTKNLIDENNFKLYNIYMAENGSVEQPDSTVTVSIPLPEGYDSTRCSIYRIEENNNKINMNAYYENGYMIFTTDHFSLYAVVDENMQLLTGDVNGDGVISIADATTLQKYLANIVDFDYEQLAVADTNGDGSVSIADATQIQKYLAELIPSLG